MNEFASPPIRCHDLSVGYDGNPVLEGLSFVVEESSTLALVGRSGCGKTTLLKTLAGILVPLAGEATVLGTQLPQLPPSGTLGYIPQGLGLVMHGTVLRNVLHGTLADLSRTRSLLGRFPEQSQREARTAIEAVGLAGKEHSRVKELSGGQRRRVAIARALVQEPRVLFADEILSELDEETAQSIVDCVRSLQAEMGMTVVIVEHNLGIAREISDQLLRVEDGSISERIEPTNVVHEGAQRMYD
ncbi:phosphonate ABC transporter ATP-binding protein [Natronorarus salvus]|uniref:phosphonate ABC transporter ATP-binding protein n=1 Tax=Natronorarus salvus TaxID=3117733 RepID=UPI002F265462